MTLRRFVLSSTLTSLLASIAGAAPATFAELELPAGGWSDLEAVAVSGDGRVLAGNLFDAANTPHAFRWTRTSGFQIAPVPFRASTISRDGASVLGSREVSDTSGSFSGFAVRWSGSQVTDILGPSANTTWSPTASNADGTIATLTGLVVGPNTTTRVGHIWAANPPANLVQPAPGWTVYDLADDASVLVGQSAPSPIFGGDANLHRPYQRHLLGTAMMDIPAPSGVDAEGEATLISGDGSTIVGRLTEGNSLEPKRPFLWTQAGGTQFLSSALGEDASVIPRGISYRGDILVGDEQIGPNTSIALLWRGFGAEELIGVLRQQGAEISDPTEIDRSQPRHGTSHFHAYATAYVVRHGCRYTVALTAVSQGEALTAVLQRLLRQAAKAGVKPRYLLLDRGFYSVDVIRYLQAARYPFVRPAVCRGRKPDHPKGPSGTRVFATWKRSGWGRYTLTNAQKKTATVSICVKCRNDRGQWRRHGRQALVYASWGLQPSSYQWVHQTYRLRFGIESSYRQLGECLAQTTSRDVVYRLLLVGVSLLIRARWVETEGVTLGALRWNLILTLTPTTPGLATATQTDTPQPHPTT